MTIIGFGLNHKTAPLALLERVCFAPDAINEFLSSLCSDDRIEEAFGLSTCNRTEFLLASSQPEEALKLLVRRIHDRKGVDLRTQPDKTFFTMDESAARHIFQVACGIDSLVVGENEILGQLRRAREAASDAGFIGPQIDPMLIRAIDVGRRARQTTAISRGNVSVASVAATLATRAFSDLSTKKGLVLGAGKTAEAAALQMAERGLKDLTIVNRTYERAQQVAAALGAREAGMEQVGPMLLECDVVVCATGAPHFIITAPMVEWAMSDRRHQPIMILDVSVPRNVDPAVGEIPGVHLHTLEDLSQLAEENRVQREAQVLEVNAFIEQELQGWEGLRGTANAGHLIAALHRQLEQVRQAYVERHKHHFSSENQGNLELFSAGLTRALLHDVVQNLRSINLETTEGRHRYEIARELLNVVAEDQN